MPALAATDAGLVLIGNRNGALVRSVSTDGGRSWSQPSTLPMTTIKSPHALERVGHDTLMLGWTEAKPNNALATPRIQSLLGSTSSDAGETWSPPIRLVTRPGVIPAAPALAGTPEQIEVVFEQRQPRQSQQRVTVGYALTSGPARKESRSQLADVIAGREDDLRESLRILTAHTLARSERSSILFVEAYFMRFLVHASEVLQPLAAEQDSWLRLDATIPQAIAFADTQLAAQRESGYWPIGYRAEYFADMATLVGLFHALEPYVDAERMQRYRQAAQDFVAAMQRDQVLDAAGGVSGGFGREDVEQPLLVSTALAGVQVHAWLYSQTHDRAYRETARSALRFILDRIQPDGSLAGYAGETPLWTAVYVQESFIAADALLGDSGLRKRMRPALSRHVDWVLGFQQADGSWDTGVPAERLRTNMIVNFLIWYHERIEARADVRAAIQRSIPSFTYDWWQEKGYYRKDAEVLRALSGVSLVALNQGRAVF